MAEKNLEAVRKSFSRQAAGFDDPSRNFSRADYLRHLVEVLELGGDERVLEVAAGTCACGRALAQYAASVTCLDATPAMLAEGRRLAEAEHHANMAFVEGVAGALPFGESAFDIVVSRLALHHIADPRAAVAEMARIVRPGGRVMVIDMVADAQTRVERDRIERLRDSSHARCLTHDELGAMLVDAGLCVASVEVAPMEQRLEPWLELTGTPDHNAREISRSLHAELAGGSPTGFSPHLRDGEIWFWQQWCMMMARESA